MLVDSAKMVDSPDDVKGGGTNEKRKLESKEDIINYLNGMM